MEKRATVVFGQSIDESFGDSKVVTRRDLDVHSPALHDAHHMAGLLDELRFVGC